MSGHLSRLAVLVVTVGAVSGCYADPGATAGLVSDAPTNSSPSASIGPTETYCGGVAQSNDSLDPTLDNLRSWSRDVIIGTVSQMGSAFWDSPTGQAPTKSDRPGPGNEFSILTPYVVTIEQALTGTRAPGEITIVIEGGRVGCYVHTVSPAVLLTLKERYVLFLGEKTTGDGKAMLDSPLVFRAFPVQADGTVLTPMDGAMTLAALSSALTPDVQSPTP